MRQFSGGVCQVVFTLLLMIVVVDVAARQRLEVVVIHSYHQNYPWTADQYEGFSNRLSRTLSGYDVKFSVEYLDTKRVRPSSDYLQKFQLYLQAKHRGHVPDLIYITDDNAMNFMLEAGVQLFKTTPVVFSGVNDLSLAETLDKQRITGVFERKGVESSIRLVQKLRPETELIIFLGDGGPTDKAIGARIKEISPGFAGLDIVHIGGNSSAGLQEALRVAGVGVVVVTSIGGVRDADEEVFELDEIMKLVTATGRLVLIMEDTYLFPGVLGGYVTTAWLQGETAARLAARILQGETVSDINPITKSPGELIFDWKVLQQFSIRLDSGLLHEARIVNQPIPFLDRHPLMVRWALGVFVAMTMVVIGLFIFVTRRKNRLIKQQVTDDLTGLPNRTHLLQDALVMPAPFFAVVDINNFKAINTFYGLETGDAVLIAVSQEIANLLPEGVLLYRMGRDQFGVLAGRSLDDRSFEQLIAKIVDTLRHSHLSIGEPEIHLTVSAGISGPESTSLIAGAEQALHVARARNEGYAVDNDALEDAERQKRNILWANKLSVALEAGRIRPFFQPIIHNASGKQEKYEALVRLIDEDSSIVAPFFFLEAAKRTRQYALLTRTMIEQSLATLGDRPVSISLNFTVEDIRNHNTVRFFKDKLNEFNVADRVVVELTEGEGIENYAEVSHFISEIKELGCRVAIDDFGTGYSNFTHLMHLNADYLKIDGSIIKGINNDKNSELVTRTLVDFARRLGMETVAEYVDSQAALDKVTALGVDYSQGFFLGKPEPGIPEFLMRKYRHNDRR